MRSTTSLEARIRKLELARARETQTLRRTQAERDQRLMQILGLMPHRQKLDPRTQRRLDRAAESFDLARARRDAAIAFADLA